MTIFGDYTDDDAYDTAPADPEQVIRKLHELRLRERLENVDFDQLDRRERDTLIFIVTELLEWGRRQGVFR